MSSSAGATTNVTVGPPSTVMYFTSLVPDWSPEHWSSHVIVFIGNNNRSGLCSEFLLLAALSDLSADIEFCMYGIDADEQQFIHHQALVQFFSIAGGPTELLPGWCRCQQQQLRISHRAAGDTAAAPAVLVLDR